MKMDLLEFSRGYFQEVSTTFKGLNLTGIKDFELFHVKQSIDSLAPTDFGFINDLILNSKVIVDVGFGGGFPILPLALNYEKKKFIGIDSKRKKVKAVEEIAKKLGIKNVFLHHQRLEEVLFDVKSVIFFKAVGDAIPLLKKITNTSEVHAIFLKGSNFEELEGRASVTNVQEVFYKDYKLPNGDGRKVIDYKKEKVPRGTSKRLVNLSQLL